MTDPRKIPTCLGPCSNISTLSWQIPEGAWDTHFHVLGPRSKFPYSEGRMYTPPDASFEALRRLHDRVSISHGFVVHANTHGFDNGVDLDAVARSNGRYFAVVRLDGTASPMNCRALHDAGARGVRFAFNPRHGGALDVEVFDHVLRCIKGLGWFVDLHFASDALPHLEAFLNTVRAPVVIDHIARIDPSAESSQNTFAILLRLLTRGNFWVKLSGIDRISRTGYPYSDVAPFVQSLLEADPARLLWGSDWPHTGVFEATNMPDDGKLLNAFADLVPDENMRHRILVQNPLDLLASAYVCN